MAISRRLQVTLGSRTARITPILAGLLLLGACSNGTRPGTTATGGSGTGGAGTDGAGGGGASQSEFLESGTPVSVSPKAASETEETRLQAELVELNGLSAQAFADKYPLQFDASPSYDVASIVGLDQIQASSLKLSDSELADLAARGFVISQRHQFPNFAYGYYNLYVDDLPVYVSADSILSAVHHSYDSILKSLELGLLSGELDTLLAGMHARLTDGVGEELGETARHDADVFLSVARSLLSGARQRTLAGGSQSTVDKLVGLAERGEGISDVSLFGVVRKSEDFSQFKPRGHYNTDPALGRYFRASMWLGRIDLRLLETQEDGSQLFRRRQVETMFLFRELIDAALLPHFQHIDRTITAFVGEPDYMALPQVDQLATDLGVNGLADLKGISDERLAQTIVDGGYGEQRISSHIMVNGLNVKTLPLSRSFALLGQRYTIDSNVFSNVVYDRVGTRLMPDPLDAAFAAFGNDQAGVLLGPELEKYEPGGYPAALASMRLLVDEHPSEFWDGSLYTLWLGAMRELSPSRTGAGADAPSLFPVARTEAWGRRLLNTQLASWAELRHDTILYAKQSYTDGPACEFPRAYVDPYPAFYAAIGAYARRGQALLDDLDLGADAPAQVQAIKDHFDLVADVAQRLGAMATHERTGADFTPEMLAFINDAINIEPNCDGQGGHWESGWYRQLFFAPNAALDLSPTIADVHTQPMDEGGNVVGNVLHVGTGLTRLMVVVADGCSGPHAYAGLASSYFEEQTRNFERLDDDQWLTRFSNHADVGWMADLVSK